jgi:sulfite oxidase
MTSRRDKFLSFPSKDERLVLLGDEPLVAETPESLLDDETTPTERFFIRNNGTIPPQPADPDAWRLVIDGEVERPLTLTLGELKAKYRAVTRHMVLECGGNGCAFFCGTPAAMAATRSTASRSWVG